MLSHSSSVNILLWNKVFLICLHSQNDNPRHLLLAYLPFFGCENSSSFCSLKLFKQVVDWKHTLTFLLVLLTPLSWEYSPMSVFAKCGHHIWVLSGPADVEREGQHFSGAGAQQMKGFHCITSRSCWLQININFTLLGRLIYSHRENQVLKRKCYK